MDHPQHRDQHEQRAEQSVQEEFVRRVDAVRPTPNADDQIHRDQAGFKEDVEQQEILRCKGADHQHLREQEQRHIFLNALFDRDPAGPDADRHEEYAQHDEHQRETVDAKLPVEHADAAGVLDELPLGTADVEVRPERDAKYEVDQGCSQRKPAGARWAEEQTPDRGECRYREHQGKNGETAHRVIAQVIAAVSPISMTNA